MAATLPTKSLPHPSSSSSSSSSDTEPDEDSLPLNNPRILQPLVPEHETPGRERKKPKKRPPKPSVRNSAGLGSSEDGVLPADEAGRPGLEHESESEDLEMSDYPHTGDEGDSRAPTPDSRRGGKRRRRAGPNPQGGDGAGVGLGDRLVMANGDRPVISDEEKKIADGKVLRDMAINALFIGLWYLFSLLISIYNKWMFSPEHLNFHFPLFTTCLHMIVQFALASLVLFAFPHFRPIGFFGKTSIDQRHEDSNNQPGGLLSMNSRAEERRKQQAGIMTKWFYITRVGPCGAATGLDIGLGNMSLKFISLTFYTMCKSSVLGFVLVFAILFRLERLTWRLVGVIAIMTAGVLMMVASETQFVPIGFFLVILASALSGLRWSLTQILLLRNPATSNPFSSIFFLAPVMFVAILLIAIPVEGFGPLSERVGELVEKEGVFWAGAIVLFPGIIAFLMVSCEFALLKRTSVVTLSICGIFKEVMTISVAAIVFKDPLTPINISGLFVTIIAIAAYNYMKIKKMREEARDQAVASSGAASSAAGAYAPVGRDDDDDNDDAVSTGVAEDSGGLAASPSVGSGTSERGEGETEVDKLI